MGFRALGLTRCYNKARDLPGLQELFYSDSVNKVLQPESKAMSRRYLHFLSIRVDQDWLERLDDWRSRRQDLPSRAEAIRQLVDVGRHAVKPNRRPSAA